MIKKINSKPEKKKEEITRIETIRVKKENPKRTTIFGSLAGLILSVLLLFLFKSYILSIIILALFVIASFSYGFVKRMITESSRIKKIEEVFPDFLRLMSSNLRAGMTIDKSMLLSARPEFYPLNIEIQKAGKDIVTGKNIEISLLEMSKRINSDKIHKTILLIISGIKAGGNLAVLLEDTAVNMRERIFVEKRAASNVMMYAIFIFVAVALGAPALFSLSSVLVDVLTKLLSGIPDVSSTAVSLPFTLSKINISTTFIFYFSIIFIIVLDILASLVLGLVMKGEEKEGFKYILPLLLISLGIFFGARLFLGKFLAGLF
jgi:archaeal flagellar protein FlaJ